jgi:hypothetical protein
MATAPATAVVCSVRGRGGMEQRETGALGTCRHLITDDEDVAIKILLFRI